jgi:hypothetical protein
MKANEGKKNKKKLLRQKDSSLFRWNRRDHGIPRPACPFRTLCAPGGLRESLGPN